MDWLAIGPIENWKKAFELSTWGITKSYEYFWNQVSPKDMIFFYITSPVDGVVGYGFITEKLKVKKPLWFEEVRKKKVLWPLRLEFEVTHSLQPEQWESCCVRFDPEQVVLQKDFQPLPADVVALILEELNK